MINVLVAMMLGLAAGAQAPVGATGICKDGTYTSATAKEGACAGHKGVHTWYGAAAASVPAPVVVKQGAAVAAPVPAAAGASVAAPVPGEAPKAVGISAERTKLLSMPAAAGGGPGLVWLNGTGKVYHCPASEFYGRTKTGAYMSEAEAKAKGAHAARGRAVASRPSS